MESIYVENLTKRYGDNEVLKGVDLRIEEGEFYALMGPNGSGKTTLVSIMASVRSVTSGKVEIYGKKLEEAKGLISYIPQENFSSPVLTGKENLIYFAELLGFSKNKARKIVNDILDKIDLSEDADKKVSHYSGGMRKRLEVATALFPGMKILILDEPTIRATFKKTFKEFIRLKIIIFWTVAWPIVWVLIGSFSFIGDAPKDVVPYIRGSITISMMVFALMIAGMANLPGNIAEDRQRGLLAKLASMPLRPWKDFVGRTFGMLVFSLLAIILVLLVGFICGARFSFNVIEFFQSIGMLLLILSASAGIGMLIGTFIKNVHGAIMTGVGASVVTAAISGLWVSYSSLPSILQKFSRIYPISSANSSIIYLLIGKDFSGYNPLQIGQITLNITLSISLFGIGLILYSVFCWKKK